MMMIILFEIQKKKNFEIRCMFIIFKNKIQNDKHKKVPLSTVGFMPGEIVNTNEFTVLIGENYFMKKSATEALESMNRRRKCMFVFVSLFSI